jgi:hypothetical protein
LRGLPLFWKGGDELDMVDGLRSLMATPVYMKRSSLPLFSRPWILTFSIPLNIDPKFVADCSDVPGMFGTMGMLFEVTGEFSYQTLLLASHPMIIAVKAQVTARTYLRGKLSFFSPTR